MIFGSRFVAPARGVFCRFGGRKTFSPQSQWRQTLSKPKVKMFVRVAAEQRRQGERSSRYAKRLATHP